LGTWVFLPLATLLGDVSGRDELGLGGVVLGASRNALEIRLGGEGSACRLAPELFAFGLPTFFGGLAAVAAENNADLIEGLGLGVNLDDLFAGRAHDDLFGCSGHLAPRFRIFDI
jgi:hypothetical protein